MSQVDLDKLMATMEVVSAQLSEHQFAHGACLHIERGSLPTIHYGICGSGMVIVEGEAAIELVPHMLVVVPANKSVDIVAADPSFGRSGCSRGSIKNNIFIPGSERPRCADAGEGSFSLVSGSFQAVYGAGLDLFASLASPVVEPFDGNDRLDRLMSYAMAELAAREAGGGAMASALFKLVLLALLRRSLTSRNTWVERFSLLNDPQIARAFAEMASRPAADFSVHTLCRSVGLSRSAFMARFTAAFGESPMSVLRRLRMRHAAGLLAANALSVEQVALQAGYQSRSSFTRSFRKHHGIDPSTYRAEANNVVAAHNVGRDGTQSDVLPSALKAG